MQAGNLQEVGLREGWGTGERDRRELEGLSRNPKGWDKEAEDKESGPNDRGEHVNGTYIS